MSKATRLAPLAELADARELEAARGLVATLRVLEVKRAELAKLETFLADYRQQADGGREARDGSRWLNVRAFIARVAEAVSLQQLEIEKLAAGHRAATARWERTRQDSRMLDLLLDRYREEETRARNRREQNELDERAARINK